MLGQGAAIRHGAWAWHGMASHCYGAAVHNRAIAKYGITKHRQGTATCCDARAEHSRAQLYTAKALLLVAQQGKGMA